MHVNCISVTLMLYEKCGQMMEMPIFGYQYLQ